MKAPEEKEIHSDISKDLFDESLVNGKGDTDNDHEENENDHSNQSSSSDHNIEDEYWRT